MRLALFTHTGMPDDVAEGLEAGAPFLVSKELVCQVDAWRERVSEILAAPHGRGLVRPALDAAELESAASEARLLAALPTVLRHPSLRGLASVILRALVRRAFRQCFGPSATGRESVEAWLLDEELPPALEPECLAVLAASFAEQLWCLLGDAASAAVRADLHAAMSPGVESNCR
jgi:hypothetical protein